MMPVAEIVAPNAAVTLRQHQSRAVAIARMAPRYGWLWDPGCGKTIAVLSIIKEIPMPTLVVCPKTIMRAAWAQDAEAMGIRCMVYQGTRRRPHLQAMGTMVLRGPAVSIVATNFDTFRNDLDALMAVGFQRLVIDESSFIRNRSAKISAAAIRMADSCRSVYILSGTPAPNGPEEYWTQLRCLSSAHDGPAGYPGSLHRGRPDFWGWVSYWLNVQKQLIPTKRRPGQPSIKKEVIAGFSIKPERRAAFEQMLARSTQRLRIEDCTDVPSEQELDIEVDLGPKEVSLYHQVAIELLATDPESGEEAKISATARLMKLRQVSGGNIRMPEGEWLTIGSAKLDALADLAQALGHEPMVIWCQFRAEADRIAQVMLGLGRRIGKCDGRNDDNSETIARFTGGGLDALVCHPRSVGHGVTLVSSGGRPCRYSVWFSMGYSYEEHQQGKARIRRIGQREKVVHYHLLGRRTVDRAILKAVRAKRRESDVILEAIRAAQAEARSK